MPDAPERNGSVLVIVDYQNDFCHEDGAISRLDQPTEQARAILPNLERLLDLAHSAGVPCVFVRVAHSEWTDAPAWSRRGAGGRILQTQKTPVAVEGTWGSEFYGIQPGPDDLVITKHRYSAFAYTPLKLVLQARNASTIVLAGVQTNVCIHSTARDAVQEGFHPVVVEDCVATGTEIEQKVALDDIRARMGGTVELSDLETAWRPTGSDRR